MNFLLFGDVINMQAGSSSYPTLVTYADQVGGYPNVYVARSKHANYPSRKSCNDRGGGAPWPFVEPFPLDDCSSNDQPYRPEVNLLRNLGLNAKQRINCVKSTYGFHQDPQRTECIWSAAKFYSWQLDHTISAEGYDKWHRAEGF